MECGEEWIVDAFGCDPDSLRGDQGRVRLLRLFERVAEHCALLPLEPPRFHVDPARGRVSGQALLPGGHLAGHAFPARGRAALNLALFARADVELDWKALLPEYLGPCEVRVRRVARGLPASHGGRLR